MRDRPSPTFTVLIVNTRKPFRASIRLMLESFGHRVIETVDAQGALAQMDAEDIEVVLVELDTQGLATTNAIRMDSNIPIVGVARRDMPIMLGEDKGCMLMIRAPLSIEELVDTLARAVARGRAAAVRHNF